jgi:hypothetical protein
MSLWMLMVLLGLIKLPFLALMLWMTFRHDEAMSAPESTSASAADSSEEDGGSKALPSGPMDPHPRRPFRNPTPPRRGPHGSPPPPARIRRPVTVRARRVHTVR